MITHDSDIAHWPALAMEALAALPDFRIATLAAIPSDLAGILRHVIADERLGVLAFEQLLTVVRRALRDQIAAGESSEPVRPLLCALAIQGYRHGYPFAHVPGEEDCDDVFVRACYAPLLEEVPEGDDPWPAFLNRVHIRDPLREQELQLTVRSLGPVVDPVSRRVRAQYEESPYPHWWRRPVLPLNLDKRGSLLVAGCGTGKHPIGRALGAPNSEVTALDLSRASLGYGMARAEDFGVTNIDWVHGDILDVGRLGKTFDEITSGGVLHHMHNPAAGLKALADALKPGGRLKFGVYPKSSRSSVVAAIALRDQLRAKPTPEGIRAFRQVIASLPPRHMARKVARSSEFYSLQSCRDMLFHEQEHRFDMPMLKAVIAASGLEFVGLHSSPALQEKFRALFPDPARSIDTDLDAWQAVEAKYPGSFGNFYRVSMRRP